MGLERLKARTRDVAIRLHLRPYVPLATSDAAAWDEAYASGRQTDYGNPAETARYAVVVGYLRMVNGQSSILDVGCGVGLLRARMQGVSFKRYLGIDLSALAIRKASALADDRTTFAIADLLTLTQEVGRFDVIVCNEVLYYLEDPGAGLDRIALFLRPGGYLLTSIVRHRGDYLLRRLLDARFAQVDAVELKTRTHRFRISCHRFSTQ